MAYKKRLPVSSIMQQIVDNNELPERLTVHDLINLFSYRSFGLIILIFATFCVLPFSIIPGVAVLLAIPIVLMGLQLGLGKRSPWMPKKLARLSLEKAKAQQIFARMIPFVKTTEKCLKPRWLLFSTKFFEYVIGWVFVLLGLMLMLPLPFSNMLFGLLILLLALGLIERDGIVLSITLITTVAIVIGILVSIRVFLS